MNRLASISLVGLAVILFLGTVANGQSVHVNGYFRSSGTYVMPHYRSYPDGNVFNNWSTYPNVNPYTGSVGTRHYSSSLNSFSTPSYSYGWNPTPSFSYRPSPLSFSSPSYSYPSFRSYGSYSRGW